MTLKIPRLGYQSVSDTWGLANVVRKVEFKLLHLTCAQLDATLPDSTLPDQYGTPRHFALPALHFAVLYGALPYHYIAPPSRHPTGIAVTSAVNRPKEPLRHCPSPLS